MRIFVAITIFVFSISMGAQANEISAEKKKTIRGIMEQTGALQLGEIFSQAFGQQMIQALQNARPDIPKKAFQIVKEEVDATVREEIFEKETFYKLMYPIYDKYFTLEELQQLSNFYNTKLGQKTIKVLPQITQESMQVGQIWGQNLGPVISERVLKRLNEAGYKVE